MNQKPKVFYTFLKPKVFYTFEIEDLDFIFHFSGSIIFSVGLKIPKIPYPPFILE